jgi:hypothetical protein
MYNTEFKPGRPHRPVPVPLHRGADTINEERRQAGTPATLEETIRNDLNADIGTAKTSNLQAYRARWLEQRYALSRNYAAVVAAELRWGGVS